MQNYWSTNFKFKNEGVTYILWFNKQSGVYDIY